MELRSALLVVLSLACVRVSQQQVVRARLPNTELCVIPQETVRVLPASGFSRSPLQSWTQTRFNAGPNTTIEDYANCLYWSFSPDFEDLLGPEPTIYQVGPTVDTYTYTETPAFLPDTNELVFTSVFAQWSPDIGTTVPNNISRLSLTTGQLTTIDVQPPPGNLGGASYYNQTGEALVVVVGVGNPTDDRNPPAIYLLDPVRGNYTTLLNNWFGQRFGGWDDVVVMRDGSIIATDANFTTAAMPPFATNLGGTMPYAVWILPAIGGPPRPLIGHTQIPSNANGLALSQDESTLYVSCSSLTGMDPNSEAAVNQLFAFDLVEVEGGYFATGLRLFAESDFGFSDGFKVDSQGNLFASTKDGVSVFNPAGTLIGKILVPPTRPVQNHPTSAIGFANNNLIIMQNTRLLMLELNTTQAAFVSNA